MDISDQIQIKQEIVTECDSELSMEFWIDSKDFLKPEFLEQEDMIDFEEIHHENDKGNELQYTPKKPKLENGETVTYGCTSCPFETDIKTDYDNHATEHVEVPEMFSCTLCNFYSYSKFDLERHASTHGYSKLICLTCKFETVCKRKMVRHAKTHLRKVQEEYKCEMCNFRCFYKQMYKKHVANHVTETIKHQCEICKYETDAKYKLVLHLVNAHKKQKTLMCNDCDFATGSKNALRIHMSNHRNDQLRCMMCDFVGKNERSLKRHSVSHRITKEVVKNGKQNSYDTFPKFLSFLRSFVLPSNWNKIVESDNVTLYKLTHSPGPVITFSVVINVDLKVEIFLYGKEYKTTKMVTPFVSSNISDIKDLLLEINKVELEVVEGKSDNRDRPLKHVSDILDSLVDKCCKRDAVLSFVSEQLKLRTISNESLQYSNDTFVLSSILRTISPDAYEFLKHSEILKLPNTEAVNSVCNSLVNEPILDETNISFKHAKNLFVQLNESEKHVMLIMDEIHVKHNFNVTDSSANSVLVFTVSSAMSNLKEMVYICPISKTDHEIIFSLIKTVIVGLEEIGYKVFCFLSANNDINTTAMSNFSENKQLANVYPHPSDKKRPLFYIFDSAHLLKSICNTWISCKPKQNLHYPDFQNGENRIASFQCLKNLHRQQNDNLVNFGFSLNLDTLYPSNVEDKGVSWAQKIFNPFVVHALQQFGSEIDNSTETADFIEIILKWWKIVNVKSPPKENRSNIEYHAPFTSKTLQSDKKLHFLNKMLYWLDIWKYNSFAQKINPETLTAFSLTIHGTLEIVRHCFNDLKMSYVLLGKFQTDQLQHRFGRYQTPTPDYHTTVRHLYESKRVLKIQSYLTLTSCTFGNIAVKKFCADADFSKSYQESCLFCPAVTVQKSDWENLKEELPVLIYLAGYCCYIVCENIKCETCNEYLVHDLELTVEDSYDLVPKLGRDKLRFPQDSAVRLVLCSYLIFNKIISHFEDEFLQVHNKRKVLTNFIFKFIVNSNQLSFANNDCTVHQKENVANMIIDCATNTLLKNYIGKTR